MRHSFRARVSRVAVSLVAALVAAPLISPLLAQQATTTATVRGTVVGADNAPVAGASVIATNAATGTHRSAQTDDRGRYTIPFLDPGSYTVRAQRIGYRPTERTGLRVSLGQVETQD